LDGTEVPETPEKKVIGVTFGLPVKGYRVDLDINTGDVEMEHYLYPKIQYR